ncbi:hypothetical protein PISMIDRAFT_15028 [Pisolithus microcarpus 441]|uniref:Uncharacterized protein n=1 Tax=Pisolithus microcarpus 441 TaxID=765257 RepID=A0A0C9YU31_9AGAM|nr:hypothetical protein PISMIDRAFT_15028 [Pisolithus microcarpus 441]
MVDEGSKDTSHAADLVAVKVVVASSHEAPAVEQEQATVVDNSTSMMQGLGSGVTGAIQASQGTEEPCE